MNLADTILAYIDSCGASAPCIRDLIDKINAPRKDVKDTVWRLITSGVLEVTPKRRLQRRIRN